MVRIGILSDTHDDEGNTKKIVNIFKKENIENVIHLGDYVSPPIVKLFKGFSIDRDIWK